MSVATEADSIMVVDVLLLKVLTCIQDEKGVNEVVFNPGDTGLFATTLSNRLIYHHLNNSEFDETKV